MINIKPYPVLKHVVSVIEEAIDGIAAEYTSVSVANLKDGDDTISIEQTFDDSGNFAIIRIFDPSEIIISKDLLPALNTLHEDVEGGLRKGLQTATVIVNDVDAEMLLIFQAAKDEFYQISNSYEFGEATEKETTKVKSVLKFGNHELELIIMNEQFHVFVTPDFGKPIDPKVKQTIEAGALKVQHALFARFKEDKPLDKALDETQN